MSKLTTELAENLLTVFALPCDLRLQIMHFLLRHFRLLGEPLGVLSVFEDEEGNNNSHDDYSKHCSQYDWQWYVTASLSIPTVNLLTSKLMSKHYTIIQA